MLFRLIEVMKDADDVRVHVVGVVQRRTLLVCRYHSRYQVLPISGGRSVHYWQLPFPRLGVAVVRKTMSHHDRRPAVLERRSWTLDRMGDPTYDITAAKTISLSLYIIYTW